MRSRQPDLGGFFAVSPIAAAARWPQGGCPFVEWAANPFNRRPRRAFRGGVADMSSTTPQLQDKLPKGDRERLAGLLKTAKAELLHLQQ